MTCDVDSTIQDPSGDIYTALGAGGALLTVFGHHDKAINGGQVHTSGKWDSDPAYNSGFTTFTIGSSLFPAHMTGWTLQPDARYPVFYPITGGTGTTVTVAGDITATLPSPEEEDVYYFLIPPAGVHWTTGALDLTPPGRTSRYLAFQYLYIPPVVGVSIESETLGAQTGPNLSGMYYFWIRFYIPETGRTTPDAKAPGDYDDPYSWGEHPQIPIPGRPNHRPLPPGAEHLERVPRDGPCCCCIKYANLRVDHELVDDAKYKKPQLGDGLFNFFSVFHIEINLYHRGTGDKVLSDCSIVWDEEWSERDKLTDPLKVTRPRKDQFTVPELKDSGPVKAWAGRQKSCGSREILKLSDSPRILHSGATSYKERVIKFFITVSSAPNCNCEVKSVTIEFEQRLVVDESGANKGKSYFKRGAYTVK